jgi:hypothetical protein
LRQPVRIGRMDCRVKPVNDEEGRRGRALIIEMGRHEPGHDERESDPSASRRKMDPRVKPASDEGE